MTKIVTHLTTPPVLCYTICMYTKEHQRLLNKYKLNNKETIYEKQLEQLLIDNNIYYKKQKDFIAKCYTCYIADFYLPRPYKCIIEVDGKYHDFTQGKDYYRDKFFIEEKGIRTLRIKNEELQYPDRVINKINTYLKRHI